MTFQMPKWRMADIWRCIVAGCGRLWQVDILICCLGVNMARQYKQNTEKLTVLQDSQGKVDCIPFR